MNKKDWLQWHYQNNGSFAVIKTGFSHALYMSLAMLAFSVFVAIGTYQSYEKIMCFSVLTLFTTSLFLLCITIPFIVIHAIHYKIFKKILIENKIEKSILVCFAIMFVHFIIICFSIDYVILKFNLTLSPIEYTFTIVAYLLGLIKGFTTFHSEYYQNSTKDEEKEPPVWRNYISKEENFF